MTKETVAGREVYMKRGFKLSAAIIFLVLLPLVSWASPEPRTLAPGLRVDFSGGAQITPSYDDQTLLLPAGGEAVSLGLEYSFSHWIPLRAEIGAFSIGASSYDASLFRFRAFWGYRAAAMTGLRFALGSSELDVLAGAALSASRFSGLDQVTAFASATGALRLKVPCSGMTIKGALPFMTAAIPLEYMFRGTARSISAGLDLGFGFAFSTGGQR